MSEGSWSHQARGAGREAEASHAIVGIGASAGGFDAFRRFFSAARSGNGMAFVLIHTSSVHKSLAAEVIGRCAHARQVGGEDRRRPNHVYVIPPGNT